MKKIISSFFILLLFSSCFRASLPEWAYGNNFKYAKPDGPVSKEDVNSALKLKAQVNVKDAFVAEQNRHVYTFSYFPKEASKGHAIKAAESVFTKFRCLKNQHVMQYMDFTNDYISFNNLRYRIGDRKKDTYKYAMYAEGEYQSEGIFYSDARVVLWESPAMTTGSVMRMRYSRLFDDVKYLSTVYFHESYPQKECVISLEIPDWLDVEIKEMNFEGYKITKSSKRVSMDDKTEDESVAESEQKSSDQPKGKTKIITYVLKDAKGITSEKNMPGMSHNLPHLIILCKSYDEKKAKPFGLVARKVKVKVEGDQEVISTRVKKKGSKGNYSVNTVKNLDELYKWYHEITLLSKNDTSLIGSKVREIIKDCKTDSARMEKIFYWVQDNIRYVAFEDGIAAFKPDECQLVLENRYGDCKGMANLLKNMLLCAGFDARLTWIGTRHLAYDYSIPSVCVDNHMICTVIKSNKRYFLDATEDFIGIDDYAHRIQGRPVLIENGDSYIIDTVPDLPIDRNLVKRIGTFSIKDDLINGLVNESIHGEEKTNILWAMHNMPTEEKKTAISRYLGERFHYILPEEITTSDLTDRRSELLLSYRLTLKNHVVRKGNDLFFNPDYGYELDGLRQDTARLFDVEFSHKLNYVTDYRVKIPEGYKVVSLPGSLSFDNPEFLLKVTWKVAGNEIVYEKVIQVKKGRISKKNFTEWNFMVSQLERSYKTYVQLSR